MNSEKLKEAIEAYFKIGFKCFPVTLSIVNGKKVPLKCLSWKKGRLSLKKSLALLDKLGTAANGIAIKTGTCSNLFVLDIDQGHGKNGFDTLKKYSIDIDPRTVSARTQSGGLHPYYTMPAELQRTTRSGIFGKNSGLDLRGNGGLVFAPPSEVIGGGRYEWIVSPFQGMLTPPPARLVELILQSGKDNAPVDFDSIRFKDERRWSQLSPKQKGVFRYYLDRCRAAGIGEDRSGKDFALLVWAVKIRLAPADVWTAVQKVSKFREKGREYFELSYRRAFSSVIAERGQV